MTDLNPFGQVVAKRDKIRARIERTGKHEAGLTLESADEAALREMVEELEAKFPWLKRRDG
jgi:hypothetical protein